MTQITRAILTLCSCACSGTVPSEIGGLSRLEVLNLGASTLLIAIADRGFDFLTIVCCNF